MAYKASFITGVNQREIHADMKVSAAGKVGYLYTIGVDTLTLLTTAPVAGTKYAMIAQSDDTLGDGHVPVEHRYWQYSDEVAASTGAKKHVAYFVVDTTDITYTTV
jgi:hypothetical protein